MASGKETGHFTLQGLVEDKKLIERRSARVKVEISVAIIDLPPLAIPLFKS